MADILFRGCKSMELCSKTSKAIQNKETTGSEQPRPVHVVNFSMHLSCKNINLGSTEKRVETRETFIDGPPPRNTRIANVEGECSHHLSSALSFFDIRCLQGALTPINDVTRTGFPSLSIAKARRQREMRSLPTGAVLGRTLPDGSGHLPCSFETAHSALASARRRSSASAAAAPASSEMAASTTERTSSSSEVRP
jgi:hypothetical protein